MSIKTNQKHVAVLVFPSSSHPQTLLTLSRKLANSAPDILFSFFSTQKANESLLSSSPDLQFPCNIKIYDVEDGVPVGYRFTGKPHEHVNLFLSAAPEIITRRIETVVEETGIKITCMLSDAFLTFSGQIAQKFGVSWITVWAAMPTSLSAHFYTQIIREKSATQEIGKDQELDFIPGLSLLRVKDLPAEVLAIGDKESVFSKELFRIRETLPKATAVIINCFEELSPQVINNDLKSKFKNYLNLGFVERTSKQGKIVAWTPQTLVLAHDSVGVFISHAGCNSLYESIVYGVPMICRPVFGDQMTMARMVEAGWKVGVTVEDGVITKDDLLKNLEMFFPSDDEQGKKMRANVEQLKKVVSMAALPSGPAARDFTKLVDIISMV